jgi:hypothetical protein
MGTQIFLLLCELAMGFLAYCLVHFVRELKLLRSHRGEGVVRQVIQERRVLRFPEGRRVTDSTVEVRRRA